MTPKMGGCASLATTLILDCSLSIKGQILAVSEMKKRGSVSARGLAHTHGVAPRRS